MLLWLIHSMQVENNKIQVFLAQMPLGLNSCGLTGTSGYEASQAGS